ncbi:plasmid partition protein ParG [Kosakonia radicincitans]|uniref:plasmid partition protein ParG n=1 Tax=Kosakonia radicincitans TaxID=283686 RepID=UPI0008CE64B2|nr:plasmid partition protein ParG [Kosakonia radicincitans]SET71183.1 ParG protein [Kosakonia radicincitans]
MALTPQNKSKNSHKTMTFGENRDLDKVLSAAPAGIMKRVNFNLDEDKHARFKAACTKQRTTISDVLSKFVDQWLKENE